MEINWLSFETEYKDILKKISMSKKFKKGAILFHLHEEYKGFYIVKKGVFKVYLLDSEGKEAILNIFNENGMIAFSPLYEENPIYPAYAEAIQSGEVLFFPYNSFKSFLMSHPKALFAFSSLTIQHSNHLRSKIFNLLFLTVKDRIIEFLKELGASSQYISIPIPKHQLALLIGTTPETISRMFTIMIEDKILIEKDGKYKISNPNI